MEFLTNKKEKIAAIIPAYNEERNIANVLKVIVGSEIFDEIVVVDGASIDNTVPICEAMGVRVLKLPQRGGKGQDMKEGVKNTKAEIIVFFDADITGLKKEHIFSLIQPVLKKAAVMCVGVRDHYANLPEKFIKIDPLLALGGERAVRREIFDELPDHLIEGFAIESTINYYCLVKRFPVSYVKLDGVGVIIKEKKWGLLTGFTERLREIWQILKIRFLLRSLSIRYDARERNLSKKNF